MLERFNLLRWILLDLFRARSSLEAEVIALRDQLNVLHRSTPKRPALKAYDGRRALFGALSPLSLGHVLAMLVVLLPFSLLIALLKWQREIQIGASLLVIAFGIFRFNNRRHPRVLSPIRPTQLALWSFVVAIAHGAGLILVPIYFGLCGVADRDAGHGAAGALVKADLSMALLVSVVHSSRDDRRGRTLGMAGVPLPWS